MSPWMVAPLFVSIVGGGFGLIWFFSYLSYYHSCRKFSDARISYKNFVKSWEAHPENWDIADEETGKIIRKNVDGKHGYNMVVFIRSFWDLIRFGRWCKRREKKKKKEKLLDGTNRLNCELYKEYMQDVENQYTTWIAGHPEHAVLMEPADVPVRIVSNKDPVRYVPDIKFTSSATSGDICILETDDGNYRYISTDTGVTYIPLSRDEVFLHSVSNK